MPMLTYREAAKRVGRTRRAIRYWRQDGMPMSWETREGQRVRVVDEAVLLEWVRMKNLANPAHQQHLRRLLMEQHTLGVHHYPRHADEPS